MEEPLLSSTANPAQSADNKTGFVNVNEEHETIFLYYEELEIMQEDVNGVLRTIPMTRLSYEAALAHVAASTERRLYLDLFSTPQHMEHIEKIVRMCNQFKQVTLVNGPSPINQQIYKLLKMKSIQKENNKIFVLFKKEFADNESFVLIDVESNGVNVDCTIRDPEKIAYSQMVDYLKMLFSLISLFLLPFLSAEETALARSKRQSYYYICGQYPNQFYSLYPCNNYNQNQCPNGGTKIGVGCYNDFQCTPYANGRQVVCSNNCCCTVPTVNPPNPGNSNLGYCYNGQRSSVRCSASGQCGAGQTCMNGLCCTTTGSEYQYSCGGLGAVASCSNGGCGAFVCVTSNYCCECQYGRTTGVCTNGCQAGYTCSASGYCCPQCPNGAAPYGSCYNGQCASGYSCRAGNICC